MEDALATYPPLNTLKHNEAKRHIAVPYAIEVPVLKVFDGDGFLTALIGARKVWIDILTKMAGVCRPACTVVKFCSVRVGQRHPTTFASMAAPVTALYQPPSRHRQRYGST
jgi:hypothetical protein